MVLPFNIGGQNITLHTDLTPLQNVDIDKLLSFNDDPNDTAAKYVYANLNVAQFGFLKAKAKSEAAMEKLNFEICYASRKEHIRAIFAGTIPNPLTGKCEVEKITETRLNDLVDIDSEVIEAKTQQILAAERAENAETFYWAVQKMAERADAMLLQHKSIALSESKIQANFNEFTSTKQN